MAIVALNPVVQNPTNANEAIGLALSQSCTNHFVEFLGHTGLGLGYDSCNAAVAIATHPNYDTVQQLPFLHQNTFSILYGNSRLFAGLDPDFNNLHGPGVAPNRPFSNAHQGEHAEQSAIRTALSLAQHFFQHNGDCHIYIDYTPCHVCDPWLRARPERWFVHYGANLEDQHPIVQSKKRQRRETFGRIVERPSKRAKGLPTVASN